jgi:hypothetical protein
MAQTIPACCRSGGESLREEPSFGRWPQLRGCRTLKACRLGHGGCGYQSGGEAGAWLPSAGPQGLPSFPLINGIDHRSGMRRHFSGKKCSHERAPRRSGFMPQGHRRNPSGGRCGRLGSRDHRWIAGGCCVPCDDVHVRPLAFAATWRHGALPFSSRSFLRKAVSVGPTWRMPPCRTAESRTPRRCPAAWGAASRSGPSSS